MLRWALKISIGNRNKTQRRIGDTAKSLLSWPNWLVAAALAIFLYWPVFKALIAQWFADSDYAYAFFVPIFVAWICLHRWREYGAVAVKPSNSGIAVIAGALLLLIIGSLGADLYLQRVSFPLLAAGLTFYFAGAAMLRLLSFPLGYSLLMIPLPQYLYQQATFPLQLLASRCAALALEVLGVPNWLEGNLLHVPHNQLDVTQACSGIRSLLSLTAVIIAYAYVAGGSWRRRVAAVLAIIPMAVLLNSSRVAFTSAMVYVSGPQWAKGWIHMAVGWVSYGITLVILLTIYEWPGFGRDRSSLA